MFHLIILASSWTFSVSFLAHAKVFSVLWQAGGRARENAEQQQVSRYHSVFDTLLEYNLALGTQWYSPVTLCLFSLLVSSLCLFINALYSLEN